MLTNDNGSQLVSWLRFVDIQLDTLKKAFRPFHVCSLFRVERGEGKEREL